MIIVRLWGGLGNQMFQYACGYAIAKRKNQELVLDTRFFNEEYLQKNSHFSKQQLNLLKFPIDFTVTENSAEKYRLLDLLQNRTVSRVIRIPESFQCNIGRGFIYIKETRLKYLPFIENLEGDNLYLDGYWQSEKYFKKYSTELKRQFRLNSSSAYEFSDKNQLITQNSVSIHMRMGDYSSKKHRLVQYNYVIDPQYYKDAVEYICKYVDNPIFYIFSNNLHKAKEVMGDSSQFVYVNEDRRMSDMDEFEIMSLCSHHIISNSTFSWWATWLSDNNGINICPDVSFGNTDIIPENWIKLEVRNKP